MAPRTPPNNPPAYRLFYLVLLLVSGCNRHGAAGLGPDSTTSGSDSRTGDSARQSETNSPGPGHFYNPIADAFDPTLVTDGGYYYLIGTSADNRLRIFRSRTIAGLRNALPQVVWEGPASGLGCCRLWSPVLEKVRGRWYIYFTVTDSWGDASQAALYVLEGNSTDPLGPYVLKPPLKSWSRGSPHPWEQGLVGPSVTELPDGRLFLSTTTFGFYIEELSTPWSLKSEGAIVSIDGGQPTLPWEGGTSEIGRPIVHVANGKSYVFVPYTSENHVTPRTNGAPCWSWCIGMFINRSGNLLDPNAWTKAPQPVFAGGPESGVYRLFALATFRSLDGSEDWIVYNANDTPGTTFGERDTFVQKFTWNADGLPNFGMPEPLRKALDVPAGEKEPLPPLVAGAQLLSNSFQQDDDADRWSTVRGSWSAREGQFCSGGSVENVATTGETRWADYAAQAAVVATTSPVNSGVDLLARVQGPGDFYELELINDGAGVKKWVIARSQGGAYQTLLSGNYDWQPGVRYWLRLDVNTERLTALISTDGSRFTLLGTAHDGAFSYGKVGLRTWGGSGAQFDDVTVQQDATTYGFYTGPGWPGLVIDAGGSKEANKEFCAEAFQEYCVGGLQLETSSAIDTSGVPQPLPMSTYQTERWNDAAPATRRNDGGFYYIVPSLTPKQQYRVRLHFAEIHYTEPGQRTFDVLLNDKLVLDEFDKVAAAGGPLRAVVREFTTQATAQGQIVARFQPGTLATVADHNPTVSAIEVLPLQ